MSRQDWEYRREIALPFSLQLDDARPLRCEEILRLLPGRRLVCRADQDGQPVLVKLFMGKDAQREAREDAAGIRAMMAAAIETPPLRLESRVADKGYPVLADAPGAAGEHRVLDALQVGFGNEESQFVHEVVGSGFGRGGGPHAAMMA